MIWETYAFAKNIHLYRHGGLNLVYDVNSGSLHLLDAKSYRWLEDVINSGAENRPAAGGDLTAAERGEIAREFDQLAREGTLFNPEAELPPPYPEKETPLLKAVCLHLAHDCDLACRYCFAGTGAFGGKRELMSLATGKRALDFALARGGARATLEADFFGGEPLLNAAVMRALVAYGRDAAAALGKTINFTLTTNALSLDEDLLEWLDMEKIGLVLSIDGRPAVHDRMRPLRGGGGSYAAVLPAVLKVARRRAAASPYALGAYYYARGTYTRYNTDFDRDVLHLADLGVGRVSVEPVVGGGGLALREEDLPALYASYDRLGEAYLAYAADGRPFSFFHFNAGLDAGPCLPKRLKGCGAGLEYAAVAPNGDIYPCHQFVGRSEWRMGSVYDEPSPPPPEIAREFAGAHINAKKACQNCWCRFVCGGGCHAANVDMAGDLREVYDLGCRLQRKRFEVAAYIRAREALAGGAA
ncbi:MAG: thioether cross-link-forming SCIFF peptide maturase [Gracilibacteraceae bacterium]|nr:thioether cross-link-forming SCIFF peptide maturase [Gracilibacteraceae bacterium]